VCSGGTSRDLTTIKEAVRCNLNLMLSSLLSPSLPDIPNDEGVSLEGQVQELVLRKLL